MSNIFTSDPALFVNNRHEGTVVVPKCVIFLTSPTSNDSAQNETSEMSLNESTGIVTGNTSQNSPSDVSSNTSAVLAHNAFWYPGSGGHPLSDISEEDAERRSLYSTFNGEQ